MFNFFKKMRTAAVRQHLGTTYGMVVGHCNGVMVEWTNINSLYYLGPSVECRNIFLNLVHIFVCFSPHKQTTTTRDQSTQEIKFITLFSFNHAIQKKEEYWWRKHKEITGCWQGTGWTQWKKL